MTLTASGGLQEGAVRNAGSLFSGYLGLDRAVTAVFGSTTAWVSDIDPGACEILAHRAPDVPNLGDITTVDWDAVERVDIITGGSPCQDLSHAGRRGGMSEGTRSNLWVAMREAVAALRPTFVVWENVRGALSACADSEMGRCPRCVDPDSTTGHAPFLRAAGRVVGDLADLGYDSRMCGLRAADVGAPHGRFRIFVVATDAERVGRDGRTSESRREPGARATTGGASAGVVAHSRGEARLIRPGLRESDSRGFGWRRPADGGCPVVAPDAESDQRRLRDGDGGAAPDADDRSRLIQRTREEPWQRVAVDPDPTERRRGSARRDDGMGAAGLVTTAWGDYEPAIRRWEAILGRPAPAPTQPGRTGNPQLSPAFVEWMMGLPAGHVTDVPDLTRNAMLKALGNGVVPQQAEAALRHLLGLGGVGVAATGALLPTPQAQDAKGHLPQNAANRAEQGRQMQLGHAVGLLGDGAA